MITYHHSSRPRYWGRDLSRDFLSSDQLTESIILWRQWGSFLWGRSHKPQTSCSWVDHGKQVVRLYLSLPTFQL